MTRVPVAYVLGGWQVQRDRPGGQRIPIHLSGTNVCQCGSFVPQRVNYAPGAKAIAESSTTPRGAVVRQNRVRAARVGIPGHRRTQHVDGPGLKQVDFSVSKRFPSAPRD